MYVRLRMCVYVSVSAIRECVSVCVCASERPCVGSCVRVCKCICVFSFVSL